MRELAKKLGVTNEQDWSLISSKDVKENGGTRLLKYHKSLSNVIYNIYGKNIATPMYTSRSQVLISTESHLAYSYY